ncbi:MAG: luciferase family protein [Pseudomonadota bacterium]
MSHPTLHMNIPLPLRAGPRPQVSRHAPQEQLDQLPPQRLKLALLDRLRGLEGVTFAPSQRAPHGTIGLHLEGEDPTGRERAFLIDQEFAHVHPGEDSSMHMILPEPLRSEAIAAGWAQPHPFAGVPTVSADTVMVYAPRNEDELQTVACLTLAAWKNAQGI